MKHEMDHRDLDERLTGLRPILVVAAQSAIVGEPRDRPLHHPAPRQQLPGYDRVVPLDELQHPTAPPPQPDDQLPRITPIGPNQSQIGALGLGAHEDELGPILILDVDRMDHEAEQQAQGIDQRMPLRPLDLLTGTVTAQAAGPTPLDRLTVNDGGRRFISLALSSPDLLAQRIEDPLSDPKAAPGVEVMPNRAFRREVVGQGPPGTTGLVHVVDGIDDLAQVDEPGTSAAGRRGQQGLHAQPLGYHQIRRIGTPGGSWILGDSPGTIRDRLLPAIQDLPNPR